jgi:hypothetical protein
MTTTTKTGYRPRVRATTVFQAHEEPTDTGQRTGVANDWTIDQVLEHLAHLPTWSTGSNHDRNRRTAGVRNILERLAAGPGEGWQQRWQLSGADEGLKASWFEELIAADPRGTSTSRDVVRQGIIFLLLTRAVLPSYDFLVSYRAWLLHKNVRARFRPDLFAAVTERAEQSSLAGPQRVHGLNAVSKLVLHTGRDLDQLTAEDLFAYRAWARRRVGVCGDARSTVHFAWYLLYGTADLGPHEVMRDALRLGRRSIEQMVDDYGIACEPIRDVLVRYLREREPAMDYNSLTSLVSNLVRVFWTDLELHHPGIDSLHLSAEVATAWKQRLKVVRLPDGSTRPRQRYFDVLTQVRAFYLDIAEWATEDASWAQWAVPSPVRRGETAGMVKVRRETTARMHQRVRDRLPHLPLLVDTAERHLATCTALLAKAAATTIGQTFEHEAATYRRVEPDHHRRVRRSIAKQYKAYVYVHNLTTDEKLDLSTAEDDAFWAWAIIETLRHTGVRAEELRELTHLGLISYQLPDTGEIVPMLQWCRRRTTRSGSCWSDRNWPACSPRSSAGSALTTTASRSPRATTTMNAPSGRRYRTLPALLRLAVERLQRQHGQRPVATDAAAHRAHRRHWTTVALHATRLPAHVRHRGSRRRATGAHPGPPARARQYHHNSGLHSGVRRGTRPLLPVLPRPPPRPATRSRVPRAHPAGMDRLPTTLPRPQT